MTTTIVPAVARAGRRTRLWLAIAGLVVASGGVAGWFVPSAVIARPPAADAVAVKLTRAYLARDWDVYWSLAGVGMPPGDRSQQANLARAQDVANRVRPLIVDRTAVLESTEVGQGGRLVFVEAVGPAGRDVVRWTLVPVDGHWRVIDRDLNPADSVTT